MNINSKKSIQKEIANPIATAKKHWVVYILPVLLIISGTFLLNADSMMARVAGGVIVLAALIRIIQVSNTRWHLTENNLFIQSGVFRKKYEQVPVFDLYKSDASSTKIGKALNFGSITARRRSDHCTGLRHSIVANPKQFSSHIESVVRKSPAHELNKIYGLKEKCVISENEYNIMRLGFITREHLS